MNREDIQKAKAENAERIANIAYSGVDISVKTIWKQLLKMAQTGASTAYGIQWM